MKQSYTLKSFQLLFACAFLLCGFRAFSQVAFSERFNPQLGMVRQAEKPFREELCLNGKWQLAPIYSNDTALTEIPSKIDWDPVAIKIPSPWNVNSFPGRDIVDFKAYPSYPKQWEKAPQAWLRTSFKVPTDWKKGRLVLHFQEVAGKAFYYLNGKKIGENFDIFFPYELDVTDLIKPGQDNELLILVQGSALFNKQEKYGRRTFVSGSFWGTHINGIWEDVYLLCKPAVNIEDVFVQPDLAAHTLKAEVKLHNQTDIVQTVKLEGNVHPWVASTDRTVTGAPVEKDGFQNKTELRLGASSTVKLNPGQQITVLVQSPVENGQLLEWTPEHPNLHVLMTSLSINGKKVDQKYQRFGWRQFLFNGSQMTLNGKPIKLRGDSWHYMGVPQMTRRYAYGWYKMLHDAGANAVRLHAEPFPSFYLDMADEMGICVLDESAIWASDGGPNYGSATYWENCKVHLDHLVHRDRNHPSVFGWSVCNEVIPVARNVFHMPDSLVEGLVAEINGWVKQVKALDPTRPWISGDGEADIETTLPTTVGHYGGKKSMEKWAAKGLPWGIGEQSMAYYGTPKQVAAINGPRAYVSQQGRMEGLATEAYSLLKTQQELGATYSSIFNIIWYGLKPMTLGMKDSSRPTTINDGVFFSHYEEGEPGMQPERVGPYTTSLNPGYDPSLPLYEPWPMFESIKDVNHRSALKDPAAIAKLDAKWEHPKWQKPTPVEYKGALRKVFYASNRHRPLFNELKNLGLSLEAENALMALSANQAATAIIIVDGNSALADPGQIASINQAVSKGACLLILGANETGLNQVNKLLSSPVELTSRQATSMVVSSADPLVNGLDNGDLYFSEISKKPVVTSGLKGEGLVILEDCGTDWNTWNGQPEYMKTAAVLKSERERKPSGAVLIKQQKGAGSIYLFDCDISATGGALSSVMERMLKNLGAAFGQKGQVGNLPLTANGQLQAALYCSRYSNSRLTDPELLEKEFLNPDQLKSPVAGQKVGDHEWRTGFVAANNYVFDLKKMAATGPEDGAVGYISFWVYSPRSLSNLLVEPDMPSLDLNIHTADGLTVKLNGSQVIKKLGDQSNPLVHIQNIQLDKGWNHILIKSIHGKGDWRLGIDFKSDKPAFLKEIHTALQEIK